MNQEGQSPLEYGMIKLAGQNLGAAPSQGQVEDELFASQAGSTQPAAGDDAWAPVMSDSPESMASMLRELPALDLEGEVETARTPSAPALSRDRLPPVEPVRVLTVSEAARQAASRRNQSGRVTTAPSCPPAHVLSRLGRRRRAPFLLPLLVLTSGIGAAAGLLAFAKSVPFAIVLALLGVVGSLLCSVLLKD